MVGSERKRPRKLYDRIRGVHDTVNSFLERRARNSRIQRNERIADGVNVEAVEVPKHLPHFVFAHKNVANDKLRVRSVHVCPLHDEPFRTNDSQ